MNPLIERFQGLLAAGTDNALLRFGLGQALLGEQRHEDAIEHLRAALQHDATYSAAWKLLGQAYLQTGHPAQARDTFEQGIAVAQERGDRQVMREMQVFLRRAEKALEATGGA
jgi:Flp pilus assembly protein TadD